MGNDRRTLALLVAITAVYVVAGKLGLLLASVHPSASPVWPPTGIAIAALLLYGLRLWPAIAVGAFLVNVTNDGQVPSSLGIAAGNALEAVAGAYLTGRFAGGTRAFLRIATVFRFLGVALVSTALSATVGVSTLVLMGMAEAARFGPIWSTWWLGDAGGALVVTPPIVLWLTRVPAVRHGGGRVELVALLGAAVLTAVFLFTPVRPFQTAGSPVAFIAMPVLVWAAFRFGPRVGASLLALLAMLAAWAALTHTGPWIAGATNEQLLFLQGATAVASVMTLTLAAGVLERQAAEERLRETEERLRLAEERKVAARDEFLGIAAHELRTPLTSLQLAVEYLQRDAVSSDGMRRSLRGIETQTRRLGLLVGQLLDTVRIQTGRIELEIGDEDLPALARDAVEEAQAGTTRHEISLVAPQRLRAHVDALRFGQVLRNLLDNAVKFSPGGGRVEVELAGQDGHFLLSVRDHGAGVPPEHRERIFERSYRGPGDPRSGGLGLGLHVSRHIVELHGGTITAEFPHDGGTRIVVRLPVGAVRHAQEREAVG